MVRIRFAPPEAGRPPASNFGKPHRMGLFWGRMARQPASSRLTINVATGLRASGGADETSPLLGRLALIAIALLLTVAPSLSRAQDGAPPVLDPADVFTDAVEVVETLPILNADNAARMLWYFDPEVDEWRCYAYADGFEEIEHLFSVRRRTRGFLNRC